MSNFWSWWIILLTTACLALVVVILFGTRRSQRRDNTTETTGHQYDGIEEYDNPLPHWWFLMFVATLVFGVGYLILYPGLGKWQGLLGWTSVGELEASQQKHAFRYAPEFARFAAIPVEDLVNDNRALNMGQRIFINNCSVCHGTDARGSFGFPNLADNDWLYGGESENIKTSISSGRQGQMPAWGAVIGDTGVRQTALYVRNLSGLETGASEEELSAGQQIYNQTCSVCHNADGSGNTLLGAPDLTNNIWLYGASQTQVEYTIRNGRNGIMPHWNDILGPEKVHLVTAYIYSLKQQ